jgi:hypothetical protein
VAQTLYRFAQGIDTRDWKLLESVFTNPFEYDYTSHREGPLASSRRPTGSISEAGGLRP